MGGIEIEEVTKIRKMGKNGTPLHHAASRGDFNLAKQIYVKTLHLAQSTDNRGRLALHLAAARGYTEIVRILLSNDDLNTCSARDIDGWNPLHLAAMNGKVEALNLLVEKCPHAAKARAGSGETILHICFEYNQMEAIKLLLENAKLQEVVNAKDDDGNTLLHLIVADQNATPTNNEIVKRLLACPNIDASATNYHKETPLDIAIKREQRLNKLKLDKKVAVSLVNSLRGEDAQTAKQLGRINWVAKKRGSLMVVASLIATMALQAGLTPPGGLFQDDDDMGKHSAGNSVLAVSHPHIFSRFFESNTKAVLGSLSVILLLISELPLKNNFFMWVLTVMMWAAITCIAYTYTIAVISVTPGGAVEDAVGATLNAGLWTWVSIMGTLLLIHTISICLRLRKVRHLKFYISKNMKKMGLRKPNTLGPGYRAPAHPV